MRIVSSSVNVSMLICLQHATSANPHDHPAIDPNYFEAAFDLALLTDAMKFVRKTADTSAWKEISEAEVLPGPAVDDDEKLRSTQYSPPVFTPSSSNTNVFQRLFERMCLRPGVRESLLNLTLVVS